MPNAKPVRYAHSDGHTDVCFDSSGRYILTCGSDGDVRIWEGIEDDDAISHRAGDKTYAITFENDRFFTATDTNTIQVSTFPDGAPDGILVRFTAPVTHMVLNKSRTKLVAGACDFAVKIVDIDTCNQKTCRGHEAPVLGLALDPKEEFLASSSCDGTVRVWRTSDQSQIKLFNLLKKCSDVSLSKTLCRASWSENGEYLYIPVEKEIFIYERNNWEKSGSMSTTEMNGVFSITCLSPDGSYLAAGSSDGLICVFDLKNKQCVDRYRNEKNFAITALAWNPKGNRELAFCDNQGQLGLLEQILLKETKKSASKMRIGETEGIFDDDDDDDLIQATNDKPAENDTDNSDSDDDNVWRKKLKPLIDDDGDTTSEPRKAGSDVDDDQSLILPLPRPTVTVEGYKPTPLQQSFQPGSTPVSLSSRFMIWNSFGIIRQYNTEEENSIDIEFHDTATHHAMHISNNLNYTIADISDNVVVLAAERDDDTPSKLTCMHFGSWDNAKEWTTSLPDGEGIEAVTVGEKFIAVATDQRNVRLFSLAGVQKEMFCAPGPVVCMSAQNHLLMVAYHKAMGVPGDQCLDFLLMKVDGKNKRNLLNGFAFPLSPKSTVSWLGFSAEGTPFYMDSMGIVRMLNRKFGPSWTQVANTKSHVKGKSDHYWVVGVQENPQQLRCIPCKGSRYPPTLPRPAVTILPFQLPMCDLSSEKSQYEETLWRSHLFSNHIEQWMSQGYECDTEMKNELLKPAQEALMKLFALSTRSDREYRALEVCDMMPEAHMLQLAIKYATRLKHMQLAQRISQAAVQMQQGEVDSDVEQEEDFRTELNASHNNVETEWAHTNGHQSDAEEVEMEDGEEEDCTTSAGPLLSLKPKVSDPDPTPDTMPFQLSGRKNPFKVAGSHKIAAIGKGSQVFDSLSKHKPQKQISLAQPVLKPKPAKLPPKRAPNQAKLFAAKRSEVGKKAEADTSSLPQDKNVSAFDLWLEGNRPQLHDQNPDVSEEKFISFAAEQFRALPRDDRQEFVKKAKEINKKSQSEAATNENVESQDKKRKRDETDLSEASESNKKQKDSLNEDVKRKNISQTTNSKLSSFAFQQ